MKKNKNKTFADEGIGRVKDERLLVDSLALNGLLGFLRFPLNDFLANLGSESLSNMLWTSERKKKRKKEANK